MKILADENIDRDIVRWLRAEGHDVIYAAEIAAGYEDELLIDMARSDQRVVLTGDLGFGEHVYHLGRATAGIVLLRLRASASESRLKLFKHHWADVEKLLPGKFVTVTAHQLRSRPLPT